MSHPIDDFIGAKVRSIRRDQKLSQNDLGQAVGVRFQQIQKYETGANRISASKLWEISKVLNVDIATMFDGAEAVDVEFNTSS